MSKIASGSALADAPAAARTPVALPLRDLAVAPENLRVADPPDDGLGELADTIAAAGLLLPLTVRPGRRGEAPAMVLDGRRRLLALQALQAEGRLAGDHPVACFVETERTRQAAAVVLTNTAAPVHVADVIVAIGKMLQARLTPAAVAAALGYGELEVRRLAALAALHPQALAALKAGRITLRQARLLARLPDPQTQAEVAEAALNGFGFQEWRVTERLDAGQVTVRDRRFALVGAARYAEAGGRLEADLFGERADVLLDPDRLQAAWTARAEALVRPLRAADGPEVVVQTEAADLGEAGLEPFGYAYGHGLDGEGMAAWRAAQDAEDQAAAALAGRDLADPDADAGLQAFLAARLATQRASEPPRPVTQLVVYADARTGLTLRAWGPPAPEAEPAGAEADAGERAAAAEDGAAGDGPSAPAAPPAQVPLAAPAPVTLDGVAHGLHARRTDVATRALIRSLADDPAAALVAVVARLFAELVLRQGRGALSLRAAAYDPVGAAPITPLDGEVRRRLAERREAWAASGLTPIAWVAGLPEPAQRTLLAELAGLSLDLREARTTEVRAAARAEAAEIAALCGAEVARHWTPDAGFLAAHSRRQLAEMLEAMGEADPRAFSARKDELVALVAARAAARGWAPAYLTWAAAPPADDPSPPGAAEAAAGPDESGPAADPPAA